MQSKVGVTYFLTVSDDNVVIATHEVVGPVGQRLQPNWRTCDFETFKKTSDMLAEGVHKIVISRHGYISSEYDVERYRAYALKLVETEKHNAKQVETCSVNGNSISMLSDNLMALCCSMLCGEPLTVEDQDDLTLVTLKSEDSKAILQKYVQVISYINKKYNTVSRKIAEAPTVQAMKNALDSIAIKGV